MRTQLFGVGVYLLLALGLGGQSYTPPEWKHKPIKIPVALPALVAGPVTGRELMENLLAAHIVRWQRLDVGPRQEKRDPGRNGCSLWKWRTCHPTSRSTSRSA